LPGGFGTLLELFNFLAHKKNKLLMDTDICLFNCEGFFNHLLSQIDVMMRENTLKEKEKNLLTVLNSIEDLKNFFN
jgi:predicted Rossmann-fold nucleotide-binding protein